MDNIAFAADYSNEKLKVYTLGQFVVKNGDDVISESNERSRKVWELFKYLLVHHDSVSLPEIIVEQLWPEQEYADAKSTVRSLVHRLRKLLGEQLDLIKFSQGGYTFNRYQGLWIDLTFFENCCIQGRQATKQGLCEKAVSIYRQGISCYKGDLLPECTYSDWMSPVRNHYHRLYLQVTCELATLLKQSRMYEDIIEELDKAIMIDYFEEELHIILLETLLAEGKISQARAHYENVTGKFYKELGLKPSSSFKQMFRLIKAHDNSENILDLIQLRGIMQSNDNGGGVLYCEPELFKFFYRLECNRAQRTGQNGVLAILSALPSGNGLAGLKMSSKSMEALWDILKTTLRNCDLLCRYNDQQILALLPTTTLDNGKNVIERLNKKMIGKGVLLKSELQPLYQSAIS